MDGASDGFGGAREARVSLDHRAAVDMQGPVRFLRTGEDAHGRRVLVVGFEVLLVVWANESEERDTGGDGDRWACLAMYKLEGAGGTPSSSLSSSYARRMLVDALVAPRAVLTASGARVALLSFDDAGEVRSHQLKLQDTLNLNSNLRSHAPEDANEPTRTMETTLARHSAANGPTIR